MQETLLSEPNIKLDFRVSQKVIHWIMAFLIMSDLLIAQRFGQEMELADRMQSRIAHVIIGSTVAILLIARLVLRVRHGAPEYAATMPDWQKWAARIGHVALYGLMILLIVTGLIAASQATPQIELSSGFSLAIGSPTEDSFKQVRILHEAVTKALIAMIAIHICAALYHQFVAKDGILGRMTRFWRSNKSEA